MISVDSGSAFGRRCYGQLVCPRLFIQNSQQSKVIQQNMRLSQDTTQSCALRDYSRSDMREQSPDRSYQTSRVERMIDKEIPFPRKRNVRDVLFWHQQVLEANNAYLKK